MGLRPRPRVAAPRQGSLTPHVFVCSEVTLLFTTGEKLGLRCQVSGLRLQLLLLRFLVGVHADTAIEESNLGPRGLPKKYP